MLGKRIFQILIFFITTIYALYSQSSLHPQATSKDLNITSLHIKSLERSTPLRGEWLFKRELESKSTKSDDWKVVKIPIAWKKIYKDKQKFKIGWYQKKMHFDPSLIGQEVIVYVDSYTAKMWAFIDNQLIYKREGGGKDGGRLYYSVQAAPIKFKVTKTEHVFTLKIDTILMKGIYQLPFEIRKFKGHNEAGQVLRTIFKMKFRSISAWIFLSFSLFFLFIFLKTRKINYFYAFTVGTSAFPFLYFPSDFMLSLFDPETMTILHYTGIVFMALMQSRFIQAYSESSKVLNIMSAIVGIISTPVMIYMVFDFNHDVFHITRKVIFFTAVLCIFYAIYAGSTMIMKKQRHGWLLFLAIAIYGACGINDIFVALGIFQGHTMIFIGAIVGMTAMNFIAVDEFAVNIIENKRLVKKLKEINTGLEERINDRTKVLNQRNEELTILFQSMNAMINSLDDGFLVIEKDMKCHSTYSDTCFEILEYPPENRYLWEILGIKDEKEKEEIQEWLDLVFSKRAEFEDLVDLGPKTLSTKKPGKVVVLDFRPIKNILTGDMIAIAMIISDKTNEIAREKDEKERREESFMIINLANQKQQVSLFFKEINKFIDDCGKVETLENFNSLGKRSIQGALHTLKGGAQTLFMSDLVEIIHQLESAVANEEYLSQEMISEIKSKIMTWKLDFVEKYKNILGENFDKSGEVREVPMVKLVKFYEYMKTKTMEEALKIYRALFLLTSMRDIFKGFEQTVSNIAEKSHKKIHKFDLQGEDSIRVWYPYYDNFFRSLIHVVTNIVEHGLPDIDEQNTENNIIRVQWHSENKDRLIIEISDNGKGIDPEQIKSKLIENGEVSENLPQHNHELIQAIFLPEFSSKEVISEFSGRGVGLSVVKDECEKLNGNIEVFSEYGKGTTFVIEIPYNHLNAA